MASKGKEVAGKGSSGKRKLDDVDKSGGMKRRNRGVLQFFEDVAAEAGDNDTSDDSDFDDDFMDDEFDTGVKVKKEPGKGHNLPFFMKEEEMSEEELEKMLGERYKSGSGFVTYAEDDYETKRSVQRNILMPSVEDPTIWKVKCMVGRERHSAFCLMQKFVDLQTLGTKLQIISAFAVEHVKGFIYIEADKQFDVNEACKGLCSIYSSRVAPVPKNEISHMFSVRSKYNEISEGTWARVKNGKYKGDLAQVVAVGDSRKRATVKLIPRIDLQALTEKYGGGVAAKGGGVTAKKIATPAPRLINSSELEEFRPLIQFRRDRDTGKVFEIFDGLMLKDGYLYKKISLDSLTFAGVMPLEDELQKFKPSKNDESDDLEWLSQLYGVQRKKRTIKTDKGGGKGEGSSGSSMENSFELHDLVCFGRKDFGVIIGMEKDDSYRILKYGSEGPLVMTVEQHELKNGLFDKKFTALDRRMKTISVNDTVKVLEGPSKGRQGIVKQIYRGTIFLYGENKEESGGHFCSKSQMCEKVKLSDDVSKGKDGGESGPPGFEDFLSSPKSPLSPKKPWESRENNREFNRGDKDGMFSVGQTLRIRVGPLKGYLCRVLAIRYSDITVKLDSQQKVLTVKCEHLSEVRGKSSAFSMSEDPESSSIKPFDLLGTQGCSSDWMEGAGTSADGGTWNAGGASAERSSWPAFPASGFSLQSEQSADHFGSVDNGSKKDLADGAWESKVTPSQNTSWGTAVADDNSVAKSDQVGGWGEKEDGWNKTTVKTGFGSVASGSWEKAALPTGDQAGSSKDAGDNWGKGKLKVGSHADSFNDVAASWETNKSIKDNQEDCLKKADTWDKGKNVIGNSTSSWNNASTGKNQQDSWGSGKDASEAGGWANKTSSAGGDHWSNKGSGWNEQKSWDKEKADVGSNWGKAAESQGKCYDKGTQGSSGNGAEKWSSQDGSSGSRADWKSSTAASENQTRGWGSAGGSRAQAEAKDTDQTSGWKRANVANGGQTENWGSKKNVGDATGWGKDGFGNQDQTDNWSKPKTLTADGGSSWNKQDGGSSWNKQDGGSSCSKDDADQQNSWGRPKTFDGGRGSGGRRGRGGSQGGRDQFGRGRSFGRGQSSGWSDQSQENSWNNATAGKNQLDSWDKGKDASEAGCWEKNKSSSSGGGHWNNEGSRWNQQKSSDKEKEDVGGAKSTWGKAMESQGEANDKGIQKDSWGKPSETWSNKDGSSGSGAGWKNSTAAAENQTKAWGNAGGCWVQAETEHKDQASGWQKAKVVNAGEDAAGWGKVGFGNQDQTDDKSKLKAFGTDLGSSWNKQDGGSSWNKQDGGSSWNKQDGGKDVADQQESWGRPKTFDGGRGTGGRRGRGGHGGRDQFGGGRSFGQGQSSAWNTQGQDDSWMGGPSGSMNATAGKNQLDSWGKGKDASEAGCWEKNKSSSIGGDSRKNDSSGWNQQKSWDKEKDGVGGDGSNWGKAVDSQSKGNEKGIPENSLGKAAEKWSSKDGSSGNRADWKSSTAASENQTRAWGNAGGSWAQAQAENTDQASGWKKAEVVSGGQTENWGNKKNGGEDTTGWGKGGFSNQDQRDSWSKPKAFNADGGSSWNKQEGGSSWNKQEGGSSWNRQAGGPSCNKADANQQDSWARPTFDGGRGSGGRRGRGGRGRDQFGRGRSYGQGQSSGWNKEGQENNSSSLNSDRSDGWGKAKSFDGGRRDGGWTKPNASSGWNSQASGLNRVAAQTNEAEGSKHQGNNWAPSNASGGGQSAGWNQSTVTKDASGTHDQAGGLAKGQGSNAQAGGWDNKGAGWNRGNGSGNGGTTANQAGGWNRGNGSGNGGMAADQAETWNKSNAVAGSQSAGSNQSKDAKEGTSGGGEPTDSWGKAAAGSWGKSSDGSGKRGW